MTQLEFYNNSKVQKQLNIQRNNAHGSEAHKRAHDRIIQLAKEFGVYSEFEKAGGTIYD